MIGELANLKFANGDPFTIALIAAPVGAVVIIDALIRRGGRGALLSALLKLLALACLAIALGEPYAEEEELENRLRLAVDVSDSMNEAVADQLIGKAWDLRRGGGSIELRPFARSAAPESVAAQDPPGYSRLKSEWGTLDIGATSLEEALRKESAAGTASLLLVSDGNETLGDARSLIASSPGTKIFPLVPPDLAAGPGRFEISRIHAPLIAPAKRSVDIRVSLINTTDTIQKGELEIEHDDRSISKTRVELAPGQESVVVAQSDPSKEGIKEIRATLEPGDSALSPSTAKLYLTGETGRKVLLLSGEAEDERLLKEALSEQAYQVSSFLASQLPGRLPPLSEGGVIVLNNIALKQLPPSAPAEIRRYVEDGGGLIMTGGSRGFGLGGYMGSPIADALPVDPIPPQTEKKRASVAVQLVLDKSGSMKQSNRMAFALEGAREVIRNLKDEDYVGIIGFDKSPFVAVRMGRLSEIRNQALSRADMIIPNGPTNLTPAIEEGRRQLSRTNAGRKHMIILTDGQVPDSGPFYLELVKDLRIAGVTVSTVLLGGEGDDGLLKAMAESGGGAFYETSDARALPRIFLSDLRVSTGERTLKEEQDYLVRNGSGELTSTDLSGFPPVRGYVQSRMKSRANLELVAQGSEKSEPLLASWKFGKGRSIAFTSDTNGRWSSYWARWGRFHEFWSDLVDAAFPERAGAGENTRFDVKHYYERGSLYLDLSLFSEAGEPGLGAVLKMPDGSSRPVDFRALARGHYLASVPGALAGKYELQISSSKGRFAPVGFFLQGDLFGEKRDQGFNRPLLEWLASASGGKINPAAEDLRDLINRRVQRRDCSQPFLLMGMLLVCLEILVRATRVRRRRGGAPLLSPG